MQTINNILNYKGIGQKPANFDEFWEKQLTFLDNRALEYELEQVAIPSNIANFYHLYFTGRDNARIHCQLITPKKIIGQYKGMLQFHGYHGDAGDFSDKVGWVAEGFVVLAMDARGQGGFSEDTTQTTGGVLKGLITRGIEEGPENLYFTKVFLDTAQAARILMNFDYVNAEEIYAQGASQGGGLTIACASLVPEIKKVIVSYPFLSDYRQAYLLGAQASAFEEIPYWFQFRDPLHKREAYFFDTLEYIDIQHLASRIKAEVHWIVGMQDTIVPPKTQLATYNQITSVKHLICLPEYGHEYLPKVSDELRQVFID